MSRNRPKKNEPKKKPGQKKPANKIAVSAVVKAGEKKAPKKTAPVEPPEQRYERVQTLAYLKWLGRNGGNPVSEEESVQIWLEAEREIAEQG